MNYDLKIIKKKYGEKMSHLCRELFPTILEEEGLLSSLLLNNFYESRYLYENIVNNKLEEKFKNYIYSLTKKEEKSNIEVIDTPEVLLEKAGYDLYECRTDEDIQKFKKYFKKEEQLCTFKGDRLKWCYVYFAVKKDVDKIKREDFINPDRQDIYGTSVISIQFSKDDYHNLSIKNRYNHTVINPDATFSNNLDNIIPGLTDSFAKYYGLIQKNRRNNFEIPGYIRARDGKYYKYNYEINNIYYCPNNIIIDDFRTVRKLDKSRYLLIDYFLIDLSKKRVKLYDRFYKDSFIDSFKNLENIYINNIENGKVIEFINKDNNKIIIEIDKYNRIVKLDSDFIEEVGNNYLSENKVLQEVNLKNLKKVGDNFLYKNTKLKQLEFPNLETVGDYFIGENKSISKFIAPNLRLVGSKFLYYNNELIYLKLPSLQNVKNTFLQFNHNLLELDVPSLIIVGNYFLENNKKLYKLQAPNLIGVGNCFLQKNTELKELNLEKLIIIGDRFLYYNVMLNKLNLANAKEIGSDFMACNYCLEELILDNLINVGDAFLYQNERLNTFVAPNLLKIGSHFLNYNKQITTFETPNLQEIGPNFLKEHPNGKRILMEIKIRKNMNKTNLKLKKLIKNTI